MRQYELDTALVDEICIKLSTYLTIIPVEDWSILR